MPAFEQYSPRFTNSNMQINQQKINIKDFYRCNLHTCRAILNNVSKHTAISCDYLMNAGTTLRNMD